MTLRSRIRAYLGIDALDDMPSLTMFKAMEMKQAQRHEDLVGAINRLNQTLVNTHAIERPQPAPGVLDWDTVTAMALAQLEREPEPKNREH